MQHVHNHVPVLVKFNYKIIKHCDKKIAFKPTFNKTIRAGKFK